MAADVDNSFEDLLDEGAIALLGADLAGRRDTLTARAYSHRAVADRTVVRLATEPLGPAEDLVMDYLGFGPARSADATDDAAAAAAAAAVGVVRRQSLGFTAWVLVHDPANVQHAFNLVKEIERCARLAATKPSHAKDGFDAAAAALAASVPHFLPAFYEQAARAFPAVENTSVAAAMFGKAREAERAHGLAVDEDVLTNSYVEFALAGAVSGKALSTYARELAGRVAADEAFRRFRRVCVERITGGLPPYAAMQADLRRLAKAAKLDVPREEQDLLRELLSLPALAKARQPFWFGYRSPLIALAQTEPEVRGRLLNHLPVTPDVGVFESDDFWLGVLAESGAEAGLTDPVDTLPAEAQPRLGAAAWLAGFAARHGKADRYLPGWPKPALFDLVRRMAPRLRADGAPLRLAEAAYPSADLLDFCLATGIDVADPAPGYAIDPGPVAAIRCEGRPDLAALAADARFQPMLLAAVERILAERHFNPGHLLKTAGLRMILSAWLDRAAHDLHGGGGPVDAEHLLSLLTRLAEMDLAADLARTNPAAWARIEAFDPAVALTHALRCGIPDEFGWSALESACEQFTDTLDASYERGPRALQLTAQWPYLIAADKTKAAVLTHDAVVHWQDLPLLLPLPASHGRQIGLRWAEGQVSVTTGPFHDNAMAWSSSPLDRIAGSEPAGPAETTIPGSIELPDGTRSFGARQSGTGVDGRTIRLDRPPRAFQHSDRPTVVGAVRFPGSSADLALVWHVSESDSAGRTITLVTADGRTVARMEVGEIGPVHAHGSAAVLPWQFWHCLTPRDPAGSAALREIREQDVRAMLQGSDADELPDVAERVRRHVPQITDDRLRLGVAGFVWHALYCAGRLAKIKASAAAGPGSAHQIGHPSGRA